MDPRPGPDLLLLERSHELSLWLLERTVRFPRRLRPSLTTRLEEAALDLEVAAARIRVRRERAALFERADDALDRLRLLGRLAHDLRALSTPQYEELARRAGEAGRLLGGLVRRAGP